VVIADDLTGNPTPPDFPGAEAVVPDADTLVLNALRYPSKLAVLFLTHNFRYIIDQLKEVLPLQPPYVGILGSRKKTEKILATVEEQGYRFTTRDREVLHYPVGLDIGGDHPESIALSVLAEIHAVLRGRSGASLSQRKDSIHDRTSDGASHVTQ
jgi:xanthine/CO dehydrogenase XdhC/CoxF family maturation factor